MKRMLGDSTNSLLTTNGAANAYKRLPSRERHPDIKIERVSSAAGASLLFSFLSGIALHIWIYCWCEKFHASLSDHRLPCISISGNTVVDFSSSEARMATFTTTCGYCHSWCCSLRLSHGVSATNFWSSLYNQAHTPESCWRNWCMNVSHVGQSEGFGMGVSMNCFLRNVARKEDILLDKVSWFFHI